MRPKFVIILVVVILAVGFLISLRIKEKEVISYLKKSLEESLSKKLGAYVSIGDIESNIFTKVLLRDLHCRFNNYQFSFKTAELGYTLTDLIKKNKAPDIGKYADVAIKVKGGSLRFKDKPPILEQADGKVKFEQDKVILEDLHFVFFSAVRAQAKGRVLNEQGATVLDLVITAEPFLDNGRGFISQSVINVKGGIDKLNINGTINTANGIRVLADGYIILSGDILDISSKLELSVSKSDRPAAILLESQLDLKESKLRAVFTLPKGSIIINSDCSKWPLVTAVITNNHIMINNIDFSNVVNLSAKAVFRNESFSHLILDISTESTILNYYPFDEVKGLFWLDKDVFRVTSLKIGDSVFASGVFSIKGSAPRIFLKTVLTDFDISKILSVIDEQAPCTLSGVVSGEILVEGSGENFEIKANMAAKDGRLGTIDYQDMLLNLKGTWPLLTIYDSRLIREETFLAMDGFVDMRDLGRERFMQYLTITTDPRNIFWDGWSISKTEDDREFKLGRELDKGIRVGFKKYMGDETVYQTLKPEDELELEYKMPDKNGSLQFKSKENEEFFGIIKKERF